MRHMLRMEYYLPTQSNLFSDPQVFQTRNGDEWERAVNLAHENGYRIVKVERIETPDMKLTKDQIKIINEVAQVDFAKASGMLGGANLVLGTQYGFLNKRVVWFENPNGSTAEKYAHVHDAYATAER